MVSKVRDVNLVAIHDGNAQLVEHGFEESASWTGGLSVPLATATFTQNILGAGMLALPYAFQSAGLVGAAALMTLVYFLSIFSMGVLIKLANNLGDFTYKGQALKTLGARWAVAAEIWVVLYGFGIVIAYSILLGDFFNALAQHFHAGDWASKKMGSLLVVVCVCWPLSCASSLGKLAWISILGLGGILFATVAVVIRYMDGSYDGPDFNNWKSLNFPDFGRCFPILVGAFGAHYNVPGLFKEVAPWAGSGGESDGDRQAFGKMMTVLVGALTISAFVYTVTGAIVYMTFGPHTQSDFSLNFHASDGYLVGVRFAMIFSLCGCFPLTMISVRNGIFNLFLEPRGWQMTRRVRFFLTTFMVALVLGLAEAAGNVGVVLDYNGSVCGTPVCFIAPQLMYIMLPREKQNPYWRAFCLSCASLGIAFAILGVIVVSSQLT